MNQVYSMALWQWIVVSALCAAISSIVERLLTYLKTRRRQRAAYRYEPKVYWYKVSTDLSEQKGLVEAGEAVTVTLPRIADKVKFEVYRTSTAPGWTATPEKEPK